MDVGGAVVAAILSLVAVAAVLAQFFAIMQIFAIKRYLRDMSAFATGFGCPFCRAYEKHVVHSDDNLVECTSCKTKWTPVLNTRINSEPGQGMRSPFSRI